MKLRFLTLLVIFYNIYTQAQTISNFQLNTPDGQPEYYADLKGSKVTVIDFWATWCRPCVNSIPKLVKLFHEYSADSVKFIGISIDGPRNISKVKPFAESLGINYPVLIDIDQEVSRDLNISVIPTLLVVGPNDKVKYIHEGFAPGDEDQLKKEINKVLHEQ